MSGNGGEVPGRRGGTNEVELVADRSAPDTRDADALRRPDEFNLTSGRDTSLDAPQSPVADAEAALRADTTAALDERDIVTRTSDTDDGTRASASLTLEGRQTETAARFEDRTGLDRGEDFETGLDLSNAAVDADERQTTDVSLTAQGREEVLRDRVAEQGGFESTGGEFVEADPDSLEFGPEGNITGVDRGTDGTAVGGFLSGAADVAGDVPGGDIVGDVAGGAARRLNPVPEPGRRQLGRGVDAVGSSTPVSGTVDVVGDVGGVVGEASADAAEGTAEFINEPGVDPLVTGSLTARALGQQGGGDEFQRGLRTGAVDATIGAPAALASGTATAADATRETGESIVEEGLLIGSAESAAATAGAAATGAVAAERAVRENPAQTTGAVVGGLAAGTAAGTAATRGAERLARAARGAARTRGTGDTVAFEDITSERGLAGESPLFRTDPDAPTEKAVSEVEARARDNPDTLQDELGERVVFRSETDRLPDDLEAQPGESELPGLFTSPDASPIKATVTSGRSSGLRLPFTGGATRPETFSAFEAEDVRAIPDRAAGSGRVAGPDPGLDTPGGRFLAEEAERGPAFVRPSGDRTPELEGIIPPGTAFERVGSRRLSGVGGGTIDLFRRAPDRDTSDLDLDRPPSQRGDGDRELFTGSEIRSRERRSRDDETPLTPPVGTSGGGTPSPSARSPPASGGASSGGGSLSDSTGLGDSGAGSGSGSPFDSGGGGSGGGSGFGSGGSGSGGGGGGGSGGSGSGGGGGGGSGGSGSGGGSGFGSGSSSTSTSTSNFSTNTSTSTSSSFSGGDGATGGGRVRLPDFDDDDDAFALGPDDDGDESPFTNPVEPAEEVFDRPESGGQTGNIGEDGPLSAPFSEGNR